ncbi:MULTISPECIES: hypothetical protein [unclassified Sphingomonas]|nr:MULTISPECIES: hypothetical protein [unclassified Sphingomonas]
MIDNFSLGLTHVLMLFAVWRLLRRDDLDREGEVESMQRAKKDRFGA